MKKTKNNNDWFYTIWTKHGNEEAQLCSEYPKLYSKRRAFGLAQKRMDKMIHGIDIVLVRLVSVDSLECTEWVFD